MVQTYQGEKKKEKGQILKLIKFETMEITRNQNRLQQTTISKYNLESEFHGQMLRKSSKKKQKI